ncbi:hypothetical protein [Anthocerotibacter panamensis]|uniref:hypothetical protein n=1 Tax=Anthocerotibacter panamensis TaxID=2857077 RepID=UPI001C405A0F|nr:hypothetical protein [Anthocerotibacter panamensis]
MSILSAPPARAFIHSPSVGLAEPAFAAMDLIDDHLDSLYHQQRILGYNIVVILDEHQERDELIPAHLAREVTLSAFPYLFARVQMPVHPEVDIDDLMLQLSAVRIS